MTAMLLGFRDLYQTASHKEERIGNTIRIETLGYLTREEVRQVNQILTEKPKRPKISVSEVIARARIVLLISEFVMRIRGSVSQNWHRKIPWRQLATPGNLIILGFALCSGIGIWILGTNGAFQSRFVPASIDTATKTLPAASEKQPTNTNAPSQIARVQIRLIQLGYLAGSPDSIWGKESRKALRAFKAANALLVNDAWDEETSAALFSANAAYAPAPAVSKAKR